jgi:hypothetical protein
MKRILLALLIAVPLFAQPSINTRQAFSTLMHQLPPELGTILALDPTLLSDDAYLGRYPELARFIAAHPEVRHNPRFYLEEFEPSRERSTPVERMIDPIAAFCVFVLITLAVMWLIRAMIDQRRWSRLAATQAEVQNKLLDRFGSSAELVEYLKTPAGAKLLESAPMPLRAESTAPAPIARVLWSVQIGVVAIAGAIGLLIISRGLSAANGQPPYILGIIALCVGLGFIASAAVSLVLSRRLGLVQ